MGRDGGGFGFRFPLRRRWEIGHDGEIAPLYTSETWALFIGDDGTDEAREVETFFLGLGFCFGRETGLKGKGKLEKEKYLWEKWYAGNKIEEF